MDMNFLESVALVNAVVAVIMGLFSCFLAWIQEDDIYAVWIVTGVTLFAVDLFLFLTWTN